MTPVGGISLDSAHAKKKKMVSTFVWCSEIRSNERSVLVLDVLALRQLCLIHICNPYRYCGAFLLQVQKRVNENKECYYTQTKK